MKRIYFTLVICDNPIKHTYEPYTNIVNILIIIICACTSNCDILCHTYTHIKCLKSEFHKGILIQQHMRQII